MTCFLSRVYMTMHLSLNAMTFNTAVKHVGSIFLNLNFGYDKWNYVAEKS